MSRIIIIYQILKYKFRGLKNIFLFIYFTNPCNLSPAVKFFLTLLTEWFVSVLANQLH